MQTDIPVRDLQEPPLSVLWADLPYVNKSLARPGFAAGNNHSVDTPADRMDECPFICKQAAQQ